MAGQVIAYYDVYDTETGEIYNHLSTAECHNSFGIESRTIMTYARKGLLCKSRYKVTRLTPSRKKAAKKKVAESTKNYYNVTDLETGAVITQCTSGEVTNITGLREVNSYACMGVNYKSKWKVEFYKGQLEKKEEFTVNDIELLDKFDRVARILKNGVRREKISI